MEKKIQNFKDSFNKEIVDFSSWNTLEGIRIRYLGRKGRIADLFKQLSALPPEKRRAPGKSLNELKDYIQSRISQESNRFAVKKEKKLPLDTSLSGIRQHTGKIHPLTKIEDEIKDIFKRMGFAVATGPEVETEYYNFDALNFPKDHPARDMQDTYYISDGVLLRTHTSPVQIRVMESQSPPVRVIIPGRVYRNEAISARSYCLFHQVEGLYVDKGVTFGNLKGTLEAFAQALFGEGVRLRFRPSYFPFTEPSAEVDISCILCQGRGCRVCKRTGWLEILGAGMVDPAVFLAVGYDPEAISGFAFGLGVDRIAMLKLGIDDIRLFFGNDLRFLEQF
ncbi:phenylalanine--tRNA ligase subunit alpha [candidate division KSB1 bacterium]|nr:phenylalanine--tRNA ligase subunit alpha [candidate division KSB1 bacterium]